jgi:hypothetical protein
VVADACASAHLALVPFAVMLAYHRSATLLALALATVVVADAGASAYLALSFATVVGALALRSARHFPSHNPCSSPLTLQRFDEKVSTAAFFH